jgi:chorismate mutase
VTDDVEADVIAPQVGGVRRLGPLTHDRKAYLGIDRMLITDLDTWLRAREADGTLAELRTRWLGPARAGAHTAFASDLEALLALVDLRLAFMPAVAAAKKQTGLPIDDPEQEEAVLAAVRSQAVEVQLDPGPAVAFFRAQIVAARAVQRSFLALPPAARPPVDPIDLVHQARPAIAGLSHDILARAADVAGNQEALAAVDPADIAGALDASLVPATDRDAIAAAVKDLRRAAPP